MIPLRLIVATCFIFVSVSCVGQGRQAAFAMNERLGRGINIGNSFEAPTETAWGNPWKPEYFRKIAELGFQHVRVPVRWETAERGMETFPYTLSAEFLDRIQQVVDTALRHKLHIVINMHHHDALFEDPAGQKERFLSQWYQIADHFRDYPDSLLFEVLNEPHGNLSPEMWNAYFSEALTEIRKTNPTRIVLMGVAEYGGLGGIPKLQLPDDDNIILTVHYYNPFPFTHQGAEWVSGSEAWLGTEWLDTEADRQAVASEFDYALQFSEANDIPVHVGEFGAYSKADTESRERWTTFLARWFEDNDLSWAYWEFSAGFGIYDPGSGQYRTGLVDALLHNEAAEPTPVFRKTVYASNFSGGTDGWSLAQQGGASGSLSATANKLAISISNPGTEGWHLQLVRNNIPLYQGKLYQLTVTASSAADRSMTVYAGKASSPWNAYSSYNGMSTTPAERTSSFVFTMTNDTDLAARLVADLGTNSASVNILEIKVEELSFAVTAVEEATDEERVTVYPNPASSYLRVENAGAVRAAYVYDLNGKLVVAFDIGTTGGELNISQLAQGTYLLMLDGRAGQSKLRIVKK